MNSPVQKAKESEDSEGDLKLSNTFGDLIEEELGELDELVCQYSRPSFMARRSKKKSMVKMSVHSKLSFDLGPLEDDYFQKLSISPVEDLDEIAEIELEEDDVTEIDEKELITLVGDNWRKSLVSLQSLDLMFDQRFSQEFSPPIIPTPELRSLQPKKVTIMDSAEEELADELESDILLEDEQGQLVHFEEIKYGDQSALWKYIYVNNSEMDVYFL